MKSKNPNKTFKEKTFLDKFRENPCKTPNSDEEKVVLGERCADSVDNTKVEISKEEAEILIKNFRKIHKDYKKNTRKTQEHIKKFTKDVYGY